jgi:hypothetical protein
VGEHGGVSMLVEAEAGRGPLQQRRQRGLARVERLAPEVVAVQFDQVQGVEEDVAVMAALAQPGRPS